MEQSETYGFKKPVIKAIHKPSLDYDGNLSRLVGKVAACGYDNTVFAAADMASQGHYKGGTWDMVELTNGSFFLSLPTDYFGDKKVPLFGEENWCNEEATAVGLSIAVNILALNVWCWDLYRRGQMKASENLGDIGYKLRDAACEHADVSAILRFID